MKLRLGIGLVLLVVSSNVVWAGERLVKTQELEKIKAELKPLRERAYQEKDVLKARKKLDAAYRAYWDAVRTAMIRLDPSRKDLVEKDVAVRKELNAISDRVDKSDTTTAAAR